MPSPTIVGQATCAFLRQLHPVKTAENVAADLETWGVKSKTIGKMLERQSTPSGFLWLALTCAYGPAFLVAVLREPPPWLEAAHRAVAQRELERSIALQQRELDALKHRR